MIGLVGNMNKVRMISDALKNNSTLTVLNLDHDEVYRNELNIKINVLNIIENPIGAEGVRIICEALNNNPSITQLSLVGNERKEMWLFSDNNPNNNR